MPDRSFDLVDEKGERDLFALPGSAHNIAGSVAQMAPTATVTIAYNPAPIAQADRKRVGRGYLLTFEDNRGYSRRHSIAM